jgi:hypothetical protein
MSMEGRTKTHQETHTRLTEMCVVSDIVHFVIYPMEQSPSWYANRFLASEELALILRNPNVHYRTHKCPSSVPLLSHLDPVHTSTPHVLKIRLNSDPTPRHAPNRPRTKSHVLFLLHQNIGASPRFTFCPFRNMIYFYVEGLLAPLQTPCLSAVRSCLFNIFIATFHIGCRTSIRNLRTRHAVVTWIHLLRSKCNTCKIFKCHGLTLVGREHRVLEVAELVNEVTIVVNCYGEISSRTECCKSGINECYFMVVFFRI